MSRMLDTSSEAVAIHLQCLSTPFTCQSWAPIHRNNHNATQPKSAGGVARWRLQYETDCTPPSTPGNRSLMGLAGA
jgi:hypothetical protein